MEFIKILESLAVFTASIVAIFGINSWRREIRGRKRYELAEEVLALFYEAKEKISAIRSIFGNVEEGNSRKPNLNETPDEQKALNHAYVIIERYHKNQDTFNRLQALRYRFMAIFGSKSVKPFYDLNKTMSEILASAPILGKLWHMRSQTYLPRSEDEYDKIIKETQKYEAIIWEGLNEPDPITQRVDSIILEIEKICEPILQKKQRWYSNILRKRI